jgi:hypothetical protein
MGDFLHDRPGATIKNQHHTASCFLILLYRGGKGSSRTRGSAPRCRRDHYAERRAEAQVPKHNNIYDLVKEAARKHRVSHWELLEEAIEALRTRKLSAVNLSEVINPRTNPTMTYRHWLECGQPYADPRPCVGYFKRIIVPNSDFEKWRRSELRARTRGPEEGTTGYRALDRKVFPSIFKRIKTGRARAAHGAALQLFDEGKIKGTSRESAAKRVSTRYLREYMR